ncbi:hypothetical protein MO867_21530, partial [Microbulbifer sp. OS29]
ISKVGLVMGHLFFANSKEVTQNSEHYHEFELAGVIKGSNYSNTRKRWDEVGRVFPTHYEVYDSPAWVIEYYGLQNASLIDDPDFE